MVVMEIMCADVTPALIMERRLRVRLMTLPLHQRILTHRRSELIGLETIEEEEEEEEEGV